MSTRDLNELRKQIDSIDKAILELLEKRMKVTDDVGAYKRAHNQSFLQPQRELDHSAELKMLTKHPVLKEDIPGIFQNIYDTAKKSMNIHSSAELPYKNIAILGLGVIGGSIAKSLKAINSDVRIITLSRESDDIRLAAEEKILDEEYASLEELMKTADLIVIASPIDTVLELAQKIAKIPLNKKVTVIDVASVKEQISEVFEASTSEMIEFLPTHPMAGSEKMGFAGARLGLFMDRPWVITPHKKNTESTIGSLTKLITLLGSKPVILDPATHDLYVSVVSHLIFVMSTYLFAFVKDTSSETLTVAGTGFETTTRLAHGNPKMHEQIVAHNYKNIHLQLKLLLEYIQTHPLTKENAGEFFRKNQHAET